MAFYELKRTQHLNISLEAAWEFFSSPKNLAEITPKKLGFKITNEVADEMYEGQIITYFVKPLLGIPMPWMTEIKHVEFHKYFVDEQRFGPYALWHHQHHFEEKDGGVLMTDIVNYKLPLGFLGDIAHGLFVKKQLDHIFDYRIEVLEKRFNSK